MKLTWKQLFGLSFAMLLFGSGVWANVADGSLYQDRVLGIPWCEIGLGIPFGW